MSDPRHAMLQHPKKKEKVDLMKQMVPGVQSLAAHPGTTMTSTRELSSGKQLFSISGARTTNVLLACLEPSAGATSVEGHSNAKISRRKQLFSNPDARTTNGVLTSLETKTSGQSMNIAGQSPVWEVVETTMLSTRVTSFGTIVQTRVKDFIVRERIPNGHQVASAPNYFKINNNKQASASHSEKKPAIVILPQQEAKGGNALRQPQAPDKVQPEAVQMGPSCPVDPSRPHGALMSTAYCLPAKGLGSNKHTLRNDIKASVANVTSAARLQRGASITHVPGPGLRSDPHGKTDCYFSGSKTAENQVRSTSVTSSGTVVSYKPAMPVVQTKDNGHRPSAKTPSMPTVQKDDLLRPSGPLTPAVNSHQPKVPAAPKKNHGARTSVLDTKAPKMPIVQKDDLRRAPVLATPAVVSHQPKTPAAPKKAHGRQESVLDEKAASGHPSASLRAPSQAVTVLLRSPPQANKQRSVSNETEKTVRPCKVSNAFPKRINGKFRRSTVLGLFPGQHRPGKY
ncbi:hypothetical protein HDK90DRAFT_471033 [Phyllosticta capitalensis]|uniref:Uncharacterized protein n=1 Tax=Phyllosticta capitalensis TaxID=121624 RepID=A0ABR1Y965_9PEZI